MTAVTSLLNVLSPRARDRLLELARETAFAAGARIFEEGSRADPFRIVRTGSVDLGKRVPGLSAAVVEQLGPGDLLGRSWLFPPHADRKGRCTVAGSGRA